MKFNSEIAPPEFDADRSSDPRAAADQLQAAAGRDRRTSVGLSAPAVMERIHKLEAGRGHHRIRRTCSMPDGSGKDVTAFIGVSTDHPRAIAGRSKGRSKRSDDVLECHHVTGAHTMMLKVKTHEIRSRSNSS